MKIMVKIKKNKYSLNKNIDNSNNNNINNIHQMKYSCPFSNKQMDNIPENNQENSRNSMISPNIKNENYSFTRYKKATTTGLKNLGNTSYLNSVLQILGSIRPFASYFLNPTNINRINSNKDICPLPYLISRLYYHLYPYPEKPEREIYQPSLIKKILDNLKIKKNPCDIISSKNILEIRCSDRIAYMSLKTSNLVVNEKIRLIPELEESTKLLYDYKDFCTKEIDIISLSSLDSFIDIKINKQDVGFHVKGYIADDRFPQSSINIDLPLDEFIITPTSVH